MNTLLEKTVKDCVPYASQGHVATYIPQLAVTDPNKVGIHIMTQKGEEFYAGDHLDRFTMQSVVKPLILLQALLDSGIDKVRALVGVEATGKPFDTFNYSDRRLPVPISILWSTQAPSHCVR